MMPKADLILALAAALSSLPAAAQSPADGQALFDAGVAAVSAAAPAPRATAAPHAAPAPAAKTPESCSDAKELETPYEATITFADGRSPLELRFTYTGCHEEERNDYLPPYTERYYEGADGYGLTIVTDEGSASSNVLISQGRDWAGIYDGQNNAALTSGDVMPLGEVKIKDAAGEAKASASIRGAAHPLYPQLKACEAADWSKFAAASPARDAAGKPAMGWEGRLGPSLVLLTKTAAFYYHEDCDICAAITRCDLSSGALSSVVQAHEADSRDLKTYRSESGVVYDASGPLKP